MMPPIQVKIQRSRLIQKWAVKPTLIPTATGGMRMARMIMMSLFSLMPAIG